MGAGAQARFGFAALLEKADPSCSPELSLHQGIRFQHLFPFHRGNILRGCSSKLSVSLSPRIRRCRDSFSKEHKQTTERNFLTLGYVPGSYIPLCLVQLVLSYCLFRSQSNAQLI